MFHMGNAVRIAAHDAKGQLLQIAAPRLGVPLERLDIRDGRIGPIGASTPSLSIKELLKQAYGPSGTVLGRGFFWPDFEEGDGEYYSRHMAFWLQGAAGAEVAVDAEPGEVRLVKLWGAYDVGKAINRVTCEGQIHGGASMGAGFALGEEVTFKNGVVLNPSFLGYRVPYSLDLAEQEAILVENPHQYGPFGAKGMGETTNVAGAPAIANAVAAAIGVRVKHLPITPDKIVEALRRQRRERAPGEPIAVLQPRPADTPQGV
jgi:CO/xanthine dehydrogenase Mo-binding subunit